MLMRDEDNMMLQEVYMPDRWKMLVGCILLNQTTRAQVDKVRHELFERWSDAMYMAIADPAQVAEVIKSCGFQNRRAKLIVEFSQAWIDWPEDTPISKYPGCGKYAEDSYKIFVDEDYTCQPEDKELKKYLQNRWPQNCEECQYKMECMDMGDCAYA